MLTVVQDTCIGCGVGSINHPHGTALKSVLGHKAEIYALSVNFPNINLLLSGYELKEKTSRLQNNWLVWKMNVWLSP